MARPSAETWRPHPTVLKVAAYAGCLLLVGAATWLVLTVVGRLSLALFPVVVALFLTRVLSVPAGWLRRRGWRPAPAAAVTLIGFLLLLAGLLALIAPPLVSEFEDLGPTIDDGITEIEDWIVEETSLDVTRSDLKDFEDDLAERGREALEDSQSQVVEGARVTLTALAGLVLALILTFFALKDGPAFQEWATGAIPERRRDAVVKVARASWAALGGYLRGAALLGLVEAVIIGATMAIVGSSLVIPVMLLTFAAAFIPLVGATVAGIIAVVVTLATGGLVPALIVGGTAIVVQQLDNDLLAPWIYGKALEMHPVVILLSITSGTALFGFVGTVLAVPVTAVVLTSVAALRGDRLEGAAPDDPDPEGAPDPGQPPLAAPPA